MAILPLRFSKDSQRSPIPGIHLLPTATAAEPAAGDYLTLPALTWPASQRALLKKQVCLWFADEPAKALLPFDGAHVNNPHGRKTAKPCFGSSPSLVSREER
jgi:hypothetical protein